MSSLPAPIRLRRERKKTGLTQSDLAFLLNQKRASISKYELNRVQIPLRSFLACCIIFDCRPEELVPEFIEQIARESLANVYTLRNVKVDNTSLRTLRRTETLEALISRIHNHTHV